MIPPTWLTRPIMYLIGAVLFALAAWWLVSSLTGGKRAKVEAKLNSNVAGAVLESGRDAVNTVGQQQGSESAVDAVTHSNSADIHKAHGADAKVDPSATSAGIKALCRRASARSDPKCAAR